MPTNQELYDAIVYHAERTIPDEMRRTAFLINARRALNNNNTEYLQRYLERVRPPIRGGYVVKGRRCGGCFHKDSYKYM